VVGGLEGFREFVMATPQQQLTPQQNEQVINHFKKMTAEKNQLQSKVFGDKKKVCLFVVVLTMMRKGDGAAAGASGARAGAGDAGASRRQETSLAQSRRRAC
jgi:hypothetical protein